MARKTRRSAATADEPTARDEPTEEATVSSPPPENEEEDVQPGSQGPVSGLRFNKTLLGRPGKQIPLTELIKRLSALGQELQGIDQEDGTDELLAVLGPVGKEVADTQLVAHKDKGVRAWTAWCAVDLLRICAPNAPFSQKQLKSIFEMIVKSVFPVLSDPSHAYYQQCNYVLKSLTEVKSIALVLNLPGSESLMTQIFTTFFDTLSGSSKASTGEQIPKAVHYHMSAMLIVLVDESDAIPQEAVDLLIGQFLRVDPRTLSLDKSKKPDPAQSTLSMKEFPPAYNVAKNICNSCPDKMTSELSKYFNDVILDASKSINRRDSIDTDDLNSSLVDLSDEQLHELGKAHRLLRELWRACPDVLQNVIPQLEQELITENIQLRVLAIETIGDMISGIGAAGPPTIPSMDPAIYPPPLMTSPDAMRNENLLTKPSSPQSFASTHAKAYTSFMVRIQDKSYLVRSAWATAAGRILATNAGGIGLSREDEARLVEDMARVLNDSDERVRIAGVKAIGELSLRELVNKIGESGGVNKTGSVFNNLAERIKDKKPIVRTEAMYILASIWAKAYGEIANGNAQVIELLGGIPSKILNTYWTNDLEITLLMDKALYGQLLPLQYPPIKTKGAKPVNGASQANDEDADTNGTSEAVANPDTIRAQRVLTLAEHLDERARTVFYSLTRRQRAVGSIMRAYVDYCEKFNGGVMDADESMINERLSRIIQEAMKHLPEPIKVKADLQKFAKAHDRRAYQLMRFCSDAKSDYKTVHNAIKEFLKRIDGSLKDTLSPLLYRMAVLIFNRSHMPVYLDASKSEVKAISDVTHGMLDSISECMPGVATTKVDDLYARIIQQQPSATQPTSSELTSDLKTCANFAKRMPSGMPKGRDLDDALRAYIQFGTPADAGKYAVAIGMAQAENRDKASRLLKDAATKGYHYGKQGYTTRLAAMSQLALLSPQTKAGLKDFFLETALEKVMLHLPHSTPESAGQYIWSDNVDDDAVAKCWAIRMATNRLRAWADVETFNKVAEPVLKMLVDLVEREGDIGGQGKTSAAGKSRIRLQAAKCLLKLCRLKPFEAMFTAQQFQKLAEVAMDPIYEVRRKFMNKLQRYSNHGVLSPRFYTIFFFAAYEPNAALKVEIVKWLRTRAAFFAQKVEPKDTDKKAVKKSTILENVMQRLLSLLAHFSDYGDTAPELGEIAIYIVFYLATIANSENISYIHHVAQRVKAVTDAVGNGPGEEGVDFSRRLHVLSDLASHCARSYLEMQGWTLQSLPGRIQLSSQLFNPITNPLEAADIVAEDFVPAETKKTVENIVQWSRRKAGQGVLTLPMALVSRKRKSEADILESSAKKAKTGSLPVREKASAKAKKNSRRKNHDSDDEDGDDAVAPSSPIENVNRRKSGRASIAKANKSYRERDDSEDDAEMEEANDEDGAAGSSSSSSKVAEPEEEMPDSDPAPETDNVEAEAEAEEPEEPESTPAKRRRGRPAKSAAVATPASKKDSSASAAIAASSSPAVAEGRRSTRARR